MSYRYILRLAPDLGPVGAEETELLDIRWVVLVFDVGVVVDNLKNPFATFNFNSANVASLLSLCSRLTDVQAKLKRIRDQLHESVLQRPEVEAMLGFLQNRLASYVELVCAASLREVTASAKKFIEASQSAALGVEGVMHTDGNIIDIDALAKVVKSNEAKLVHTAYRQFLKESQQRDRLYHELGDLIAPTDLAPELIEKIKVAKLVICNLGAAQALCRGAGANVDKKPIFEAALKQYETTHTEPLDAPEV